MATLPRPLTMTMSVMPAATASSMTSWMVGTSTIGSISLGMALVAGRNRVPSPAAGMTAFMIGSDRRRAADHHHVVGAARQQHARRRIGGPVGVGVHDPGD